MPTARVVLKHVKEALGSPVQGQGRDEEAVWDIRTSALAGRVNLWRIPAHLGGSRHGRRGGWSIYHTRRAAARLGRAAEPKRRQKTRLKWVGTQRWKAHFSRLRGMDMSDIARSCGGRGRP